MKDTNRNKALALSWLTAAIVVLSASVSVFAAPVPMAGTGLFRVEHRPGPVLKDSCFECHSVIEGTSVIFKDDVHYRHAISCADCHGGDPKEDDQNLSMSAKRGFKIRVTRQATPGYCGRCHKNASFMRKFNPNPRVDQLSLYKTSVHAKRLAAGRAGSAECVDCHGVHNIRAVSDPLSPAHPQHVTETCAKCHAATADLFRKSPHGRAFTSKEMPGCTACHASHATRPANRAMLTGKHGVCTDCHDAGSVGEKAAAEIARLLAGFETTAGGSKETLARVRVAVHTFDVAAIKRAAEPAMAEGKPERK